MAPVENTGALDERTYTMSWREAIKDSRKMLAIVILAQFGLLLGGAAGKLMLTGIVLLVYAAAETVFSRRGSRVRVSKAGIRGNSARVMTWEEVNGVIPHTLGGIILQSTYCPSLGVRSSIMADMAFRQDVLGLLSDDHVFASHLRESKSAPGGQPQSPTA